MTSNPSPSPNNKEPNFNTPKPSDSDLKLKVLTSEINKIENNIHFLYKCYVAKKNERIKKQKNEEKMRAKLKDLEKEEKFLQFESAWLKNKREEYLKLREKLTLRVRKNEKKRWKNRGFEEKIGGEGGRESGEKCGEKMFLTGELSVWENALCFKTAEIRENKSEFCCENNEEDGNKKANSNNELSFTSLKDKYFSFSQSKLSQKDRRERKEDKDTKQDVCAVNKTGQFKHINVRLNNDLNNRKQNNVRVVNSLNKREKYIIKKKRNRTNITNRTLSQAQKSTLRMKINTLKNDIVKQFGISGNNRSYKEERNIYKNNIGNEGNLYRNIKNNKEKHRSFAESIIKKRRNLNIGNSNNNKNTKNDGHFLIKRQVKSPSNRFMKYKNIKFRKISEVLKKRGGCDNKYVSKNNVTCGWDIGCGSNLINSNSEVILPRHYNKSHFPETKEDKDNSDSNDKNKQIIKEINEIDSLNNTEQLNAINDNKDDMLEKGNQKGESSPDNEGSDIKHNLTVYEVNQDNIDNINNNDNNNNNSYNNGDNYYYKSNNLNNTNNNQNIDNDINHNSNNNAIKNNTTNTTNKNIIKTNDKTLTKNNRNLNSKELVQFKNNLSSDRTQNSKKSKANSSQYSEEKALIEEYNKGIASDPNLYFFMKKRRDEKIIKLKKKNNMKNTGEGSN